MSIKNVSSETLKEWIKDGKAVIVDVREKSEHLAEKISGSYLVPLGNLCKKALPHQFLSDTANKKLVLNCSLGKRGLTGCSKLLSEDPNLEIHNLEGGIEEWKKSGNKVETSNSYDETETSCKIYLPLNRQVQLTIGFGILLGSLLGHFVGSVFFIVPAIFGAGLCYSAFTGKCYLEHFVAKAPWNKNLKK